MTSYRAQIETFSGGIIRVFEDGAVYGEPYDYCLPFRQVDEQTIEMVGVFSNGKQNNVPLPHQWRAIRAAAHEAGLTITRCRRGGANPGNREVS
jgi:hypothetical protein